MTEDQQERNNPYPLAKTIPQETLDAEAVELE